MDIKEIRAKSEKANTEARFHAYSHGLKKYNQTTFARYERTVAAINYGIDQAANYGFYYLITPMTKKEWSQFGGSLMDLYGFVWGYKVESEGKGNQVKFILKWGR